VRQIVYLVSLFLLCGCGGYTGDIDVIDELKHPTKFPDIYQPDVLDIDNLIAKHPLGKGEKIKLVSVGETKYASIQMMTMRTGIVVPTHYHKHHDVLIHTKKGGAIVILEGTHYYVTPGDLVLVPRKTWHKLINTGKDDFVSINVFYPYYDGEDIKFVKEKKKRGKKREMQLQPAQAPQQTQEHSH
jgi:quercetin dioxygenase-like cupin family protein